jgi:hypothetical protein
MVGMAWMSGSRGCAVLAAAVVAGSTCVAQAKPAQCFTTDDGHYPCDFRGTDRAGSFRITAPGYPTITLEIESDGAGWAFADFGTRNVALPGPYYRASDDRACWENPDTEARICAW